MFHSIRTRLTFIFILFFLILESIQLISLYLFLNDAFLTQKENTMLQAFDEMNDDQLENPTVFQDIVAVLQDYEVTSNLYFCLVERDSGDVLYSTNDSIEENIALRDVNDEVYDEEPDPRIISGYNSNNWLVLYRSILTEQHCYNTVIWTCYEAELKNTVLGLSPILLLTLLLSCVVGGLLSFQFAGHIVKPIQQIDRTAQKIACQDFSTTLKIPKTKDELQRLAKNINQMSQQLEQDMTQLKAINSQLEQDIDEKSRIDRMRREFLSNVSHELKTPLSIISSYAEMLKYEGEHIDTGEYTDVILDETRQMNQMIGKLLDLSRLEHAAEHLELSPCNLSETVESLMETRRILFQQKGLSLNCSISPNLTVRADETYLSQAMDNYLGNALKYTSEGGSVTVQLKMYGPLIRFQVTNTCPPISEEEQREIWESFYKLDKSRSKDRNMSVGLGLYIVKTIVEAHDGNYGLENTEDGVSFYIDLPPLS